MAHDGFVKSRTFFAIYGVFRFSPNLKEESEKLQMKYKYEYEKDAPVPKFPNQEDQHRFTCDALKVLVEKITSL